VHVHLEALALADDADDRVARDRPAAARQLDGHAFGAADQDGPGGLGLDHVGAARFDVLDLGQAPRDDGRQAPPEADVGHQLAAGGEGDLAQEAVPGEGADLAEGEAVGPQGLVEQALAEGRGFFLLGVLEEMADLRAGLAGAHVAEPGRVGAGVGGGDDLDLVAVVELGAQRHQLAVDAPGDAAVAHVGMHRVGEVDHRGAAGQREDLALGREGIHLAREEVDLDVLEELAGIARGGLQLEQRLQPAVGFVLQLGEGFLVFLVEPVGGDAALGHVVHLGVRICTSTGVPKGPISVVCSDW
jgi:hypothetical protein